MHTAAPRVIQCGEITAMALGRGSFSPNALSAGPAWPGSSANMGEPWEMKRVGNKFGMI